MYPTESRFTKSGAWTCPAEERLKEGARCEEAALSLRPTAGVLRAQGLPPALGEHRGPLHARRQNHGLGQRRHLLLLLAEDAGQHLPVGGRGAPLGAQGHAALSLLRDTAGAGWEGGDKSGKMYYWDQNCEKI